MCIAYQLYSITGFLQGDIGPEARKCEVAVAKRQRAHTMATGFLTSVLRRPVFVDTAMYNLAFNFPLFPYRTDHQLPSHGLSVIKSPNLVGGRQAS
jgi:hypothetical protein